MNNWLLVILGILILVAIVAAYTGTTSQLCEGFAPYYIPWYRRYFDTPYYYNGFRLPYFKSAWYWWPYYGPQVYWRKSFF